MTDPRTQLEKIVGGTYTVERELGGGGMSRVYLAKEITLGRSVVIKVLPPEMSAAVNVERFGREIQLAARLQHPHIVSMLTAASGGELLYYVMPYISGESLRAKLGREGALPVAESVKILREIVDALAYAHAQGVVHRDIKPDNVLLSTGHAVVTDFGVAKAVSASSGGHSSLTSLGVALGTPAYMAPEQAAADPNVDHRADIYAVGALAYEMLTGRTPFVSPTPQGMLAAHITQVPDPLAKHRPNVSAALNTVLMRCLEKHPADRWQTAGDLLAQLETVLTPSGGTAPTDAIPAVSSGTKEALKRSHPIRVIAAFAAASIATLAMVWIAVQQFGLPDWVFYGAIVLLIIGLPIILATGHFERKRAQARATGRIIPPNVSGVHRLFTWQRAIQGGYLAFTGLGVLTAGYTAMRLMGIGPVGTLAAAGRLDTSGQLIVADFLNRTTDSTLGGTLTEAFRIDLSQSRVIRIMSNSAMRGALNRMQKAPDTPLTMEVAQEMAVREGARAIIAGEVSAAGRSYVLVARIVNAAEGQELVALRETATDDAGIVAAVDRLSGRVRERIGESLKTIRGGAPLAQVTTTSLPALRLYTEANRLVEQNRPIPALALLEQAVALDTGFAMAWRKIAVALGNSAGSVDRQVDAVTRAYRHRNRLPEIEGEQATAYYFTVVDRRTARVEAAYRRILELDSTNGTALNNLSGLLTRTGRAAEGESLARRGVEAGRSTWFPLVMAQLSQGNFNGARQSLDGERAVVGADNPGHLLGRAVAMIYLGPTDSAIAAARALESPDLSDQGTTIELLLQIERARGRLGTVERLEASGIRNSEQRELPGSALWSLVDGARTTIQFGGDTAKAIRIMNEGNKRFPMSGIVAADRPYGPMIVTWVMVGRLAVAKQLLQDFEAAVPEGVRRGNVDWFRARGFIALAEGRTEDAIAEFRAMAMEPQTWWLGHWESGLAFDQDKQTDSAIAHFELAASRSGDNLKLTDYSWVTAPSLKRLGELYEAKGDRSRALENYGRFAELWKDADPVLQPQVREVKARMAKLAGEPK